ncbi:MAG: 4-(cytidine 5'-diphospho)-2-C-methyl-D-erythritol kinase [Armatimonadota bacterium]
MQVNAYAKINWHLKILKREKDGYHNICTVFQSVSLKDVLKFKKREKGFIFKTNAKGIPRGDDNLVLKAARALSGHAGAEIFLDKKIPHQAGMGGGSADAAAALNALNILLKINLPEPELAEKAACLGADVAFNLKGGTAIGTGRGEKLKFYKNTKIYKLVIVKPDKGVPTKRAYEEFDKLNLPAESEKKVLKSAGKLIKALRAGDLEAIKKYAVNDFEKVIYPGYPGIKKIRDEMIGKGAVISLLCGSGSAVFGLFKTSYMQNRAYSYFKRKKNIRVYKARTLG